MDEQRRRYVIQSLLVWPGLDLDAYRLRFGDDCFAHLPQLRALETLALAQMLFFESDETCATSYKDRGGKYLGQTGVTLPKI